MAMAQNAPFEASVSRISHKAASLIGWGWRESLIGRFSKFPDERFDLGPRRKCLRIIAVLIVDQDDVSGVSDKMFDVYFVLEWHHQYSPIPFLKSFSLR